jgi:hypothetical protein
MARSEQKKPLNEAPLAPFEVDPSSYLVGALNFVRISCHFYSTALVATATATRRFTQAYVNVKWASAMQRVPDRSPSSWSCSEVKLSVAAIAFLLSQKKLVETGLLLTEVGFVLDVSVPDVRARIAARQGFAHIGFVGR